MKMNLKAMIVAAAAVAGLSVAQASEPDCGKNNLKSEAYTLINKVEAQSPSYAAPVRQARDLFRKSIDKANTLELMRAVVILTSALPNATPEVKAMGQDVVALAAMSPSEISRTAMKTPAAEQAPTGQQFCSFVKKGGLRSGLN